MELTGPNYSNINANYKSFLDSKSIWIACRSCVKGAFYGNTNQYKNAYAGLLSWTPGATSTTNVTLLTSVEGVASSETRALGVVVVLDKEFCDIQSLLID